MNVIERTKQGHGVQHVASDNFSFRGAATGEFHGIARQAAQRNIGAPLEQGNQPSADKSAAAGHENAPPRRGAFAV